MAGSTRGVSSPLPETSLLARSCNKAERERYFVLGESLPPASAGDSASVSAGRWTDQTFCTRIAVQQFPTG
jgi:hypothetical protein